MLAEQVPAFEAAKVVNSWVGSGGQNAFDQNGIVGRTVAELISHGRPRTVDFSLFGHERISAGRSIREAEGV